MKRDDALNEIAKAPIQAHLDSQRSIRLTLPHGNYFGAGPICRPGIESRLTMYELRVHPKLRMAGLGTRLMSGMIYLAKELQPDRFSGIITSPHTPRILRSIVGEAGVDYLEYVRKSDEEVVLPLTTDQAMQSIKHTLRHGDPEYDGIVASINLGVIALDNLEKPVGAEEVIAALRPKFEAHHVQQPPMSASL